MAPKRFSVTGRLGLRYLDGIIGTPVFGQDEQVLFSDGGLMWRRGEESTRLEVRTLAEACAFLEIPYRPVWYQDFRHPLAPLGPDAQLSLSIDGCRAIVDWFGYADTSLELLRNTAGGSDLTETQLWPEHFDLAFEMGSEGARATYGASCGDGEHEEPYIYVSAWDPVDRAHIYWNDLAFNGASLSFRELLTVPDPHQAALEFYLRGLELLTA